MIEDDIKIDYEVEVENADPNNSVEYSKRSEKTIKKDVDKEYRKCINPVYGTLLGG